MGLVYHLLPRLGYARPSGRLAGCSRLYGGGQLLHIVGLVWSGGYGVQRKVASAEQVLRSSGEIAGMGLMGLGGPDRDRRRPGFVVVVARGLAPEARGMIVRRLQRGLQWLFMRVGRCSMPPSATASIRCTTWARSASSCSGSSPRAGSVPVRLLRDRRRRRPRVGRGADAPPMVCRRHPAQRAPLRVGRLRADDAAACCASSRSTICGLSLVLVGHRRAADLARLRIGHQRLHAALGPAGAVRHHRELQWLDWLPMFGGALMRNFIYARSVNDRFFSLLAFMHRHSARRAAARDVDPRAARAQGARPRRRGRLSRACSDAAWPTQLPVLSQGARPGLARARRCSPGLVLSAGALPLVLPWPQWRFNFGARLLLGCPGCRRWRRCTADWRVQLRASTGMASRSAGGTRRDDPRSPDCAMAWRRSYECRNGGRGVLPVQLLRHGQVAHGAYQRPARCRATRPGADVLRRRRCPTWRSRWNSPAPRPQLMAGATRRVDRLERLAPEMIRLVLAAAAGERLGPPRRPVHQHRPRDGQRRVLFANPPQDGREIELHVRPIPGGRFTTHVFEQMKVSDTRWPSRAAR